MVLLPRHDDQQSQSITTAEPLSGWWRDRLEGIAYTLAFAILDFVIGLLTTIWLRQTLITVPLSSHAADDQAASAVALFAGARISRMLQWQSPAWRPSGVIDVHGLMLLLGAIVGLGVHA